MQNFTLRLKGKLFYLLTLFLIIGTLSSYGQDCGTPAADQNYCYLETIQDLINDGVTDSDANTEIFETGDSVNDTDPIDRDELLTDGTEYFIGSSTDDCARVPVTVTVAAGPRPENEITNGRDNFTISPCDNSGFTAQDLEDLFTADAGYELEVYGTEFGETALDPTFTLNAGDSYFVGQVDDGSGSRCPSTRAAVGFDPIETPGPTAEANQTYCEGATVADLMASGTETNTQAIRWYRSETSNSPLADDVELVNGEDYFAGQVVNDRNSPFPPCETPMAERTRVVVEIINFDAGPDVAENICEDELESRLASETPTEVFLSLLEGRDLPSDVTFNPSISSIVSEYSIDPYQTFTTAATFITEDGCEDVVVISLTVDELPNAGEDSSAEFCADELVGLSPAELAALIADNIDPTADTGGTFDPTFTEILATVDPTNPTGTYSTTYTVTNGACSDSATYSVTINEGADAGDDNAGIICEDEVSATFPNINAVRAFYLSLLNDGVSETGSFNPTINEIVDSYLADEDGLGDFTTTYTVSNGDCEDSVELTASIIEVSDANAGSFDDIDSICSDEASIDLTTLDNNDPEATSGGTFTGEGVTDNTFDASVGPGTYTITYTVDESSSSCITGSESTTFTITVSDGTGAGEDNTGIICESEVEETFPNREAVRAYYLSLLSDGVADTGTFNPTINQIVNDYLADDDGFGDFTTTYTVGTGSCTDSAELTISVLEEVPANAGNFDNIVDVCSFEDSIDLAALDNNDPEATTGGTFTGDGVSDNIFDPSIGTGSYTITYSVDDSSSSCNTGSDSTSFTITVAEGTGAGEDNTGIICESEIDDTFPNREAVRAFYLDLLSEGVSETGTFNPTINQIVNSYLADEDGFGDFTTTYTIESGSCTDSVQLTISVLEEEPANAGDFDDIFDVCSDDDMINLNELTNNDADAIMGGTFTGESVTDNMFDPSIGAGTYTITYNVDESTPCITGSDSTSFDITVVDAPISSSISRNLCISEARDIISNPAAGLAYLQDLVEEAGVDAFDADNFNDGFEAEAARLAGFIDTPSSESETFNFEYTDTSDSICDDGLITISITINDLRDAEAGNIENQTVCGTGEMIDLTDFFTDETVPGGTFSGPGVDGNMFDTSLDLTEDGYEITYSVDDSADCVTEGTSDSTTFTIFIVDSVDAGNSNSADVCRVDVDELFPSNSSVRAFYLDLLDSGVSRTGTFAPTIQQLINVYNSNPDQDEFTTTYTIDNGSCSDSVELTINVYDALPAIIGDIADPDPICRNAEDVDLFSFLPADANPNGTFEGYEDGVFSPMMSGAGTFDITYTLTDDSPCTEGEASATFTLTVLESAFAGMDMDLSVCMDDDTQDLFSFLSVDADDNGEFTYNGDVITDGMMNPSDFVAGTYTVIYTVPAENDCGEDTAEFTITVEEAPDAPTVDGNPFTFCATDDATVADLSATGTNLTFYTDEDLTMMVAAEDALESGTYYVTQRNDDGACESEAAEISVTINDADTPTISEMNPSFCEFDDATIADLTDMINEAGTITWYDSADGDNALSSGTSLQDGVTYYATIFNVDTGCESSVRLAVTVSIDDDCPIIIPEGFSPNGDGLNDTFEIRNIRDKYPNFTMEIRNRFGDVVYKGNANTPDWDGFSTEGSFGSDILPVGAYFYYLNWNDGSTEPVRGTVYLSR
ncbi:gliding motility-associated C-terminal domain-containing protein [Christiangramia sp. SM2212]|uniref:Gliding motility-associated C-terminal domain-containing protein n=1 Tax=Christiangramia sediminicola TaxID=3073267 RepID=A0ABU1ETK6_9FLAO|nr:gliding motility-associated C-terminal domain-containing protein [Christiangramia sp. SM2212]MDR5591734.1 gliding motility-associated C-terminal domain-containing protein [Christiangramia sp. SM2212]